jgi:HEAT repeat protein
LKEEIYNLLSGDESLAETAMKKLIERGAVIFPVLVELLDSPDPDHRWWALSTAAQIEGIDADWLIAALGDESIEVQQAAALGLTEHHYPKAVPALINSLCASNTMLVTLATNALSSAGTDAVPALLEFLSTPQARDIARVGAIRALAEIADRRAIPALMAALEEDSALISHWAESGLEKLGLDMVYMKLD